jgi:antitoxin ParD1/3/4/toxin ParE1/3/4
MRYRLTEAARQDVREITDYIRRVQKCPHNARLVATRLQAAFDKLVQIPQLGHVHEELGDNRARVYAVTRLLVIYDPTLKPLTILRVVHAARDLRRVDAR